MRGHTTLRTFSLSFLVLMSGIAMAVDPLPAPATPTDITLQQHAQALINYQAQTKENQSNKDEQHFYMAAPGSPDAIKSAVEVKKIPSTSAQTQTTSLVSNVMSRGLVTGGATEDSYRRNIISDWLSYFNSSASVVSVMPASIGGSATITQGTATIPSDPRLKYAFSTIMQSDNVPSADAQRIVNTLSNPYTTPLSMTKNESGKYDMSSIRVSEYEPVSDSIITQVLNSVATNALGDVISRRTVTSPATKSQAQIYRESSLKRFSDTDWYANIAISSSEALLREIAEMQALNLAMQHEQLKMQEDKIGRAHV